MEVCDFPFFFAALLFVEPVGPMMHQSIWSLASLGRFAATLKIKLGFYGLESVKMKRCADNNGGEVLKIDDRL